MKKHVIAFIILIALFIIFTFYPGLKREKVLQVLNSSAEITQQHTESKVQDQDLQILPVPFGVLASTYEGMWYVTFWGKVL